MALVVALLPMKAAPAMPGAMLVTQPDGSTLLVETFGDEHQHWTATTDGVLLQFDKGAYYVADITDDGDLKATNLLAHEVHLRTLAEAAFIKKQSSRLKLFHERGASLRRAAAAVSESSTYLQHTGSPRVLVVLVQYKDLSFSVNNPLQAFDQFLNGDQQADLGNNNTKNINSIRQYFAKVSHGAFTPQFDVKGPITMSENMAYYGAGASSSEKVSQLLSEILDSIKNDVVLAEYDNDGDHKVELIYTIFAGYGQNQGGSSDALWAKVSNVNKKANDSITISRFGINAELFHPQFKNDVNGIGVFVHEFGHAMGLPDLYPTTADGCKVNNQTMDNWDVMDQGLYNGNSYTPAAYTAWEQEAMGWLSIEPLTSSKLVEGLLPTTEEGGKAYKIVNSQNDREFIVLENIQQRGMSVSASGHGLLAYHVAYPYVNVNMTDHPNNTVGKPAVSVIPADGLMISTYQRDAYKASYGGSYTSAEYIASLKGDPFPGTSSVTTLADSQQLPNFKFYDSEDGLVGGSLSAISEDAKSGSVSFTFTTAGDTSGISETFAESAGIRGVYTISGQRLAGNAEGLPRGLYIINGKKAIVGGR